MSKPSSSSSSSTYLSQSTLTYRIIHQTYYYMSTIRSFKHVYNTTLQYWYTQKRVLTRFFSNALSFNNLGQNSSSSFSFFITCICTLRGNTLYVEPSESTGLKNTISNSYSLFSDLPLNVSVSSFRLIVASLSTSANFF